MLMRIPLTKYGLPEVVVYPAIVAAIMAGFAIISCGSLPVWAIILPEMALAAVLILVLFFFRDPARQPPIQSGAAPAPEENYLLSPADGRVTNIEMVEENNFIQAPAMRIGIFMSIFNAHVNRSPCNARVERVTYKPGRNRNAANPDSGRVNQSNSLGLVRTDKPTEKLLIRQISGAIARRIVCRVRQGQKLTMGEKFGMIKFGSRCELYVQCPMRDASCVIKCLVQVGDKVKAGLTPLVKYEITDKI